jgi:hypothetical protein
MFHVANYLFEFISCVRPFPKSFSLRLSYRFADRHGLMQGRDRILKVVGSHNSIALCKAAEISQKRHVGVSSNDLTSREIGRLPCLSSPPCYRKLFRGPFIA